MPGVNTPWPRYDAERDPLIDSCQPAPVAGADGETKQPARSTHWSDVPEPENAACSSDWSSEEHRPLQPLKRTSSGSAPAMRAASDASAEDEPCAESRAQDMSFQDSKATYQNTLSDKQTDDQDYEREESCLLDEEDELEDVPGSYPTSQEIFLKEQIDSAHAALHNPSIFWGARKQAIAEIKMLTPQYKKMRSARLHKAREENAAWRTAYETELQAAPSPSQSEVSEPMVSGRQKKKEQLAKQNEQEDNIAPSQEKEDEPPMSREAEQIIAAYEALGQKVAQAKAEFGKFSQEWLDATQAQRKARPAWWLAQERLAEWQREGAEGAIVPLPFTGTEQIALVPPCREAATSLFDLEAHKARVLRQAATFATNPACTAWPAG